MRRAQQGEYHPVPIHTAAKVFLSGVTALVMLCAAGTTALGQEHPDHREAVEVPLVCELPAELGGCVIDHAGLSSQTGFQVRPPLAAERSWKVRVVAAGEQLTVILHRPDREIVCSKPLLLGKEPCQALVELLSVLLSAHVPEVGLMPPPVVLEAASRPANPATRPSSSSQPKGKAASASPERAAPADSEVPPAIAAASSFIVVKPRPTSHWFAGLGGGVVGFDQGPAGLGLARAHIQLGRRLVTGGQVLLSHRTQDVAGGQASIWVVEGRATAGFFHRRGRLSWSAGGLAGARLTRGTTTGLSSNGSASLGSLSLGLCGDLWWAAGRRLRLGLGTNVVFLLPRAAFEVSGAGQVYGAPLPAVEVHLFAGWEGQR